MSYLLYVADNDYSDIETRKRGFSGIFLRSSYSFLVRHSSRYSPIQRNILRWMFTFKIRTNSFLSAKLCQRCFLFSSVSFILGHYTFGHVFQKDLSLLGVLSLLLSLLCTVNMKYYKFSFFMMFTQIFYLSFWLPAYFYNSIYSYVISS